MWALARDQYPRRRHLGSLESPYRKNSSGDQTRFNPRDASGGREEKRGDGGDGPGAIRKTARRARRRMLPAVARKSEETAEPSPERSEKPHDEHDAGCFRRSREKARRRRSRPRSDQKKNRAILSDGSENRADRI